MTTPDDVTIRAAVPQDAAALAALISLAYRVEDFFKIGDRTDPDDVRIRMKEGTFLLMEERGGVLVGCVYVKINLNRETGYFGMLSIDPSRQGQGFGVRMIKAAEGYCRDAGCREMELEVVNLRTELPPFYRKFGYVETGTRPFPDLEKSKLPCHFVVMSKSLA